MDDLELAYTSATRLAQLVRSRELSPVEVVDRLLARIEQINPQLNAYCTLAPEHARAAAQEAEAAVMRGGSVLGPLLGVPVSIKDLTPTAGIRTTYGSRLFADNVPTEDALIVARLKAAGAIVMGKTNTPELGAGINTTNAVFGPTCNPWNTALSPGGSSGGAAAALAAGLGPLAEGSDHGGSLRIPAALCGVVGFRTSAGRIPKYPGAWLYDPFAVTGPMARTVADVALMLSAVAGPDERVPISLHDAGVGFARAAQGSVAGLGIAFSRDLGIATVASEIADAVALAAKAFTELGCTVEEAHPDFGGVREMIPPLRTMRTAAASPHLLDRADEVDNAFLREYLTRPATLGALDVARAEEQRSALWLRVQAFFRRHDFLVTPTTATAAFPIEHSHPRDAGGTPLPTMLDAILLTYAITMTGLPAISVPCGFTSAGLPIGMQIVGRRHAEPAVLRLAGAFEQVRPWSQHRPALATAS